MIVVIDTNVLITSIPKRSKYRPIFDGILKDKFKWAVSESILQEYLEIIGQKSTKPNTADNFAELILQLKSLHKIEVHFKWNLIQVDPDDNKFVDCAVAAKAKFIVTNDKHFNVLKKIEFPSIEILNADEFLEEVLKLV
ncbi:MAG: putative toxin-antitoxin system toxin component, PIN family [Saprospiraceae bacterium]